MFLRQCVPGTDVVFSEEGRKNQLLIRLLLFLLPFTQNSCHIVRKWFHGFYGNHHVTLFWGLTQLFSAVADLGIFVGRCRPFMGGGGGAPTLNMGAF